MSNTTYCSFCGKANQTQGEYCFNCGKELLKLAMPVTLAAGEVTLEEASQTEATQVDAKTGRLKVRQQLNSRYTILSLLGQGGMGAVYKAEDARFANRLVAVKEMRQSGLDPQTLQETTEQFKQEANILASLNHPNLPSIYDHFEENGRWYLAMDFIEGTTLEKYVQQAPGCILPVAEVVSVGIQLAKVLNYLHTRPAPIIFRDLKPLNVMITPDAHIYLIDFGIARLFKQGQTKDTVAYISQGYAAPEQFMNAQTTPQSDIYSLGATLHQLLSGKRPSANVPLFAFTPLSSSTIPHRLTTLVIQMVAVETAQRPANMALVKQELEEIQTTLSHLSVQSTQHAFTQNAYADTPVLFAPPPPPMGYADTTVSQYLPLSVPITKKSKAKLFIPLSIIGVLLLIGAVVFGGVLLATSQNKHTTATSSPAATVGQVATLAPTIVSTVAPTPTPTAISYPAYSDARSAIKYYYENESDFRGKNILQQFDSLTYKAQTGPPDQPQFLACAQYTYGLVTAPNVTTDTARHTFTFQYGNNTWMVIDMGSQNSC